MTMGNRIVVMKDGFIQQADTPITLFEDPCNLFVATFLGSPQMNIIDAELFIDGKQLKAKLNGLDDMVVTFPEVKAKQLANKKYIGQKVLLGIRPEHVRPNEGDIQAHIEVVEHLGDESILYCKMENRKDQFIVKIPFNSKIHANEDVNVEFNMEHVYLFDAETHKAIMGIPHEDEIPVRINNNIVSIGEQDLVLEPEFVKHLLDSAFDNDVNLAIKPEYVSLTRPMVGNEIPVLVNNNVLNIGNQRFIIDKNNMAALYDKVFTEDMVLVTRPWHISLEEMKDALDIKAKVVKFEEDEKTQVVSFAIDGVESIYKVEIAKPEVEAPEQSEDAPVEEEPVEVEPAYKEGDEVTVYIPYDKFEVLPENRLALKVKAKVEFMEQKTDYQAVYFSLEGVEGYFAFKMRNDEKVPLGKVVDVYLPYERIKIYDQEHNKVNSREVVYENSGTATVKVNNGVMKIKVGNFTLEYPSKEEISDGQYEIVFKQDKLVPIYTRKMLKAMNKLKKAEEEKQPVEEAPVEEPAEEQVAEEAPVKEAPVEAPEEVAEEEVIPEEQPVEEEPKKKDRVFYNEIKVSAYDEDVLGDKLLVYVQIPGCTGYSSLVVDNNFSVYKMPKFKMYVPEDAFELKPIK